MGQRRQNLGRFIVSIKRKPESRSLIGSLMKMDKGSPGEILCMGCSEVPYRERLAAEFALGERTDRVQSRGLNMELAESAG